LTFGFARAAGHVVRLKTLRSRIPLADAAWRRIYRAYHKLSKPHRTGRLAVRLPPRIPSEPVRELSVVAIMKDEGPYLREWIEFQRLMGVSRVYLYDNGSTDDSNEVVTRFVAERFATVIPWMTFATDAESSAQLYAYAHALCNFGPQFRWMAFIDLDEFLFPVSATNLVEVLSRYEDCPCLCVPWFMFGFSEHESRPAGLVIENYTQRSPFPPPPDREKLLQWKSVVQPAEVVSVSSTHMFDLACGITGGFDERKRLVTRRKRHENPPPGAVLRINHYFTRSRREFAAKVNRKRFDYGGGTDRRIPTQRCADLIEVETVSDDAILRFVPALRERVAA
jgi:Glycosyltransferase family 92